MVRPKDLDKLFSCFSPIFPYCPAKIIDFSHLFCSCQVCNVLSRKVNMTVSSRQVNLRDGDAKRNIPERKDLPQQVKIFHAFKTYSSCREDLYARLWLQRASVAPLRPREAADELRLMEPVPAWSAEAAGRWDFWGKHPLFSTETQAQCSLLSLSAPQHRAWPGTAQWDALRAQGPPSTASVLSPAMSQPPSKLPTAAVGPQISVWHFQIQSFSQ